MSRSCATACSSHLLHWVGVRAFLTHVWSIPRAGVERDETLYNVFSLLEWLSKYYQAIQANMNAHYNLALHVRQRAVFSRKEASPRSPAGLKAFAATPDL